MAEEVLVSVKIDRQGNQDELSKLTNQIVQQKNEVKQLETAIKTLSKAEGDNTALIKATTKNLEIKKQQLNQNVASQKALVNVVNAEVKSLNALRAENALLIRQRNALNLETEEGQAAVQKINARIDENNEKIKQNSSALEKQKQNVGNYRDAVSQLNPALGGLIQQVQGVSLALKALAGVPILIFIGALVAALATVVNLFKDTAVGADLAARETEGFDYVITRLKDKINAFSAEVAKGEGNTNKFIEAQSKFIKLISAPFILPFQKVIDKYKEASEVGKEYADVIDSINDAQAIFKVDEAELENQIKRTILQSKNRTLSEQERIKLIDDALELERRLQQQREDFAKSELSALLQLNEARLESVGIRQTAEETQLEFAKRAADEIRNTTLDRGDALADSFINALVKIQDAIGGSIAIEEKLLNQRDALLDKQAEKELKRREELEKQKQEDDKKSLEEYEFQLKLQAEGRAKQEEERIEQNRIENEQAKTNADFVIAQEKRKADAKISFEKMVFDAKINFANSLSNFLLQIAGKNKAIATIGILIEKATAIAQIISNRGIANMKALALSPETFGQPFVTYNNLSAAFSIGSTIAAATQQLSAIQGFARGGKVGNKGLSVTRSNGDTRLITAKENEVVLTTQQRSRIGDEALRAAGVPGFATGGIVGSATNSASIQAESRLDINRLSNMVNRVRTVLVLQDFEAKKMQVDQITQEAIVL